VKLVHGYYTAMKSDFLITLIIMAFLIISFTIGGMWLFGAFWLATCLPLIFVETWKKQRNWRVYNQVMPIRRNSLAFSHYLCFVIFTLVGLAVGAVYSVISSFFGGSLEYINVVVFSTGVWVTYISFYIPLNIVTRDNLRLWLKLLLIALPIIQVFLVVGTGRLRSVVSYVGIEDAFYQVITYISSGTTLWVYVAISSALFMCSIAVSAALYKKIDII